MLLSFPDVVSLKKRNGDLSYRCKNLIQRMCVRLHLVSGLPSLIRYSEDLIMERSHLRLCDRSCTRRLQRVAGIQDGISSMMIF